MLKPITTQNSINTRKPCHDPKQMKQISASIMINVFIYLFFLFLVLERVHDSAADYSHTS